MTDLDDDLREVLDHQAAHTAWEPTPVGAVAGRARRTRRRRRAGAVVGATVLVAAGAVPTALVRDGDDRVSPAGTRDPASAPPRIGYAVDDVYRVPSGGTIGLPPGTTSVTPTYGPGDLLVTDVSGSGTVRLREVGSFEPDDTAAPGKVRPVTRLNGYGPLERSTSAPVVDNRGLWSYTLVFPERTGIGLTVDVDGYRDPERSFTRGLPDDALLLGIDHDTQRVVFLEPETGRVATIRPQQSPRAGTTIAGIDLVQDYSSATHLFADTTPDGQGGGVVDDTGRRLWESDEVTPGGFSPDGTRVLAVGGVDLEVLDARTGGRLATLPGAAELRGAEELRDVVWEDDTHLLATRAGGDGRELVRVGPGGRVTPLDVPALAPDADLVWDTRP